jgi:hypothetical protein
MALKPVALTRAQCDVVRNVAMAPRSRKRSQSTDGGISSTATFGGAAIPVGDVVVECSPSPRFAYRVSQVSTVDSRNDDELEQIASMDNNEIAMHKVGASLILNELASMKDQLRVLTEGQAQIQTTMVDALQAQAELALKAWMQKTSSGDAADPPSEAADNAQILRTSMAELSLLKKHVESGVVHPDPSNTVAENTKRQRQVPLGRQRTTPNAMSLLRCPTVSQLNQTAFDSTIEESIGNEQSVPLRPKSSVCSRKMKCLKPCEQVLDCMISLTILLHAVFIGFSMDMDEGERIWLMLDIGFFVMFTFELGVKLLMHGCIGHFARDSRGFHIFDASLVLFDAMQIAMILGVFDVEQILNLQPSAKLTRTLRLVDLARLLRLVGSADVFKDLRMIMRTAMGGSTTFLWAVVLLVGMMYVVSLLFRETIGRQHYGNAYEYFDSVPRSILTTFRCGFGDCETKVGTPILENIYDDYGFVHVFFYVVFVFTFSICSLNMINAIFTERTIAATQEILAAGKQETLRSADLWASGVETLAVRLMDLAPNHMLPSNSCACFDEISCLELDGSLIGKLVRDPEAAKALEDLGVDPEAVYVSNMLDPDRCAGAITFQGLVQGINRLRGGPRRSEIVIIDLMVRSIQRNVDEIVDIMKNTLCTKPRLSDTE